MAKLKITDNARQNGNEGWLLEQCCDAPLDASTRSETIHDLHVIGGKRLKDVVAENPNILLFPPVLGGHQDGVEDLAYLLL